MDTFAIIGFSFRFPQGAENEDEFWEILQKGRNVMTGWPETRANVHGPISHSPDGFGTRDVCRSQVAGLQQRQETVIDTLCRLLREALISWTGTRLPLTHPSSPLLHKKPCQWIRSNDCCWRFRIWRWKTVCQTKPPSMRSHCKRE